MKSSRFKKAVSIILATLFCFTIVLANVGCGSCGSSGGGSNDNSGSGNGSTPSHTHSADAWDKSESVHWKKCECGVRFGLGAHSYGTDGKCTTCEQQKHVHTANTSEWNKDAQGHWHATSCAHSVKMDYAEHSFGADNKCTVCSYEKAADSNPDDHTHVYTQIGKDANNHWNVCACGERDTSSVAAHVDSDSNGKCDVCDYTMSTGGGDSGDGGDVPGGDVGSHTHTFESDWSTDSTNHWHAATCEHTDEKSDLGAHADADSNGKCDVCDYTMSTGGGDSGECQHTNLEDWITNSVRHQRYCLDCGEIVVYANHDDSDGNGKCDACDYAMHVHTYASTWSKDGTYHWHAATCSHTNLKGDQAEHTFDSANTCTVCDYVKSTGGDSGSGGDDSGSEVFDTRSLTPQEYAFANLTGDDKYGRTVQIVDPSSDKNRYVGIFYSGWLGTHINDGGNTQIYDVNVLQQTNNAALLSKNSSASPADMFHFASEPLYGYYSMRDPWVVTRHIELLTMAGIDYLMFDCTNAVLYTDVFHLVIQTLLKYQAQGWDVPKVAFYTNSDSNGTMDKLWTIYQTNPTYNPIWLRFAGDERPVIVGMSTNNGGASDWWSHPVSERVDASGDMYKYFNFFESQWPNMSVTNARSLPWMALWNRAPYVLGAGSVNGGGNIAASVIQHNQQSVWSSDCITSTSRGFQGWDYDGASTGSINSDWAKGDNLEWQITSARKYFDNGTAKNLLVTGWNEWMAIKNVSWQNSRGGYDNFIDAYDAEHARDVEMGKVYGDTHYMQLARHTREIKYGTSKTSYDMWSETVNINNANAFANVSTEVYADFVGDAMSRDAENAARVQNYYKDNSNRNDIHEIRITYDASYVYVNVTTAKSDSTGAVSSKDVTAYTAGDTGWMNLMIGIGSGNSFMGFNYIINRSPNTSTGKTSIERCNANNSYSWTNAGEAEFAVNGNEISYKIPRSVIGLTSGVSFTFKVTDNVTNPSDPMSYYIYGDSAPIGRNGYAYNKQTVGSWS